MGDLRGLEIFVKQRDMNFDGILIRFLISSYRTMLLETDYVPTTINKKINSFASYNRFLIEKDIMTEMIVHYKRDRVKIAKGTEKLVEVYDEKLTNRLLLYIEDNVSLRYKVIVQLLYYTGVRVSKLCSIRIKYIDILTHQLKVYGKGGKFREVPLKPEVVESIKAYLIDCQKHKYSNSEYLLFVSGQSYVGDSITEPEQIYHFLSQVMKESDNWYTSGLGGGLIEIGSVEYFNKYQGRLGNTHAGDGALFRGAGYLHLTGRSNYTDFYQHMLDKGIDDPLILSEGYSRVAEKYAWESAAWFWSTATNLNEISFVQGSIVTRTVNDNGNMVTVTGNSTVFDVTKRVNGGTNGISDRIKYYNLVKDTLYR